MQRRRFVSLALGWGSVGGAACCAVGCGTLLHSERSGRPHSNQIDWKMAALDGLGLILFFVPGVVAFAVDFYTGAIYLPEEPSYPGYGTQPQSTPAVAPEQGPHPPATPPKPIPAAPAAAASGQPAPQELGLKRVVVPRGQLQQARIELVAANHVGQPVSLDDSQTRLSRLSAVDQFGEQASRHRSDRSFGFGIQSLRERLHQG